ncbi:hypothetical protein ACJMK2_006032 [Sinanodonta woodiana]|uniref:HP domain-containing protein n=1 Tax=Sinanodonta woodiana TaxID=1069815 RepID=A0ABD3VT90_SINWO
MEDCVTNAPLKHCHENRSCQGQTKASKRRESNGESSPSPKKEPRKSPKRTSRTPSGERTPPGVGAKREVPTIQVTDESPKEVKETILPVETKPVETAKTRETDIMDEKENVPMAQVNGVESNPKTPTKVSSREVPEPHTPTHISEISNHKPQATSTPAVQNGVIRTGNQLQDGPYSDEDEQDQTDQSDDEAFTSEQQDSSYERKIDLNYGKFYNASYLKDGRQNYLKKTGISQEKKSIKSPHFHRPENFTYSKDPPSFLRGKKSGMMQLTSGTKIVKVHHTSSPAVLRNEEPVRMSMYPGGEPSNDPIAKIEREDWPAPPSPAAILPEILRQRRKSRGEKDDDDDENLVEEDPKIKREIEELSKFKDESGIGKIIYKELEEQKIQPKKLLDPWKASRVPGADHEPKYQTRYQSPMFASPSRFWDRQKRSWDDSDIRGYRTISTMANFPVPKPGYAISPRAATLPVAGAFGGPLNYTLYDFDVPDSHDVGAKHSTRVSISSINTDASSRHEMRSRTSSSVFEDKPGVSLMTFQRNTWHTETAPKEYTYEVLKISNFILPKDVDRNRLEIHLSTNEFENIFKMSREAFERLAEWKKNDIKKRLDLF